MGGMDGAKVCRRFITVLEKLCSEGETKQPDLFQRGINSLENYLPELILDVDAWIKDEKVAFYFPRTAVCGGIEGKSSGGGSPLITPFPSSSSIQLLSIQICFERAQAPRKS